MTAYERALMHAQERHDDELFSDREHEEAVRIKAVPVYGAGPWSVWFDNDPEGEWERDGGWDE